MARLRAQLRGQAPYLTVLACLAAAVGFLLLQPAHWRRGVAAIAGAVLLAALLRLLLPDPAAGMLAVRRRWLDVSTYLVLGGLILFVDIRLKS
jgi:Na+-transporting NADH:ubiquinone oxidoreductase subunit NqrB